VIGKIHDIKELVARGRVRPAAVFAELRTLAASDQWQTREVAATALVEIAKKHPAAVLDQARRWARDRDAYVRRAASEGLRGMVKVDPEAVRPILEVLRRDPELYIKKCCQCASERERQASRLRARRLSAMGTLK
jgi:3-methyladenine DNA glycosylase AlkC